MWLSYEHKFSVETLQSCVPPVTDHKTVNSVTYNTDPFSKLLEASRLFKCDNVSLGKYVPTFGMLIMP
jgi:hypothetical protein